MSRSILAAAGILFLLFLIAAIAYLIFRLLKSDSRNEMQTSALVTPDDPMALLRARYDSMFLGLGVPENAMIVRLACNSTSPAGAASKHYCWINDGFLMLFPLWESFTGAGAELPVSEILPRGWRIPVSDIVCYATQQGLPTKFLVLQFKKDSEILTLAFSVDSLKVFSMLMPEKDLSNLLEEIYPKSSRNIRDIKENFISLKELRQEDLITEDEYTAKKKEMLILM